MGKQTSIKTKLGNIKAFDIDARGYDDNSDFQYSEGKKIINNAVRIACKMAKNNKMKNFRVLDAGCGNGRSTINLYVDLKKELIKIYSSIDINVTGIDISKNILKIAQENMELDGVTSGKLVFKNKSIEELCEEDGLYDIIFSNFALHLCTPNVYRKFYERLNNGGVLLINQGGENSVSNMHDLARAITKYPQFIGYYENWEPPFYYPSKDDMEKLLKDCGYKNIQVVENEYKDYNYEKCVQAYVNASLKVYLELLSNDSLVEEFKNEFIKLSEQQKDKYKQIHRLYILAVKNIK